MIRTRRLFALLAAASPGRRTRPAAQASPANPFASPGWSGSRTTAGCAATVIGWSSEASAGSGMACALERRGQVHHGRQVGAAG